MYYVHRVGDLAIFTNIDKDIGFEISMKMLFFRRLVNYPDLQLPLERCEKLYWLMCQFAHVYIKDGKLFRKKRIKGDPYTYYKIPTKKDQSSDNGLEDKIDDYLKHLDDLDLIKDGGNGLQAN